MKTSTLVALVACFVILLYNTDLKLVRGAGYYTNDQLDKLIEANGFTTYDSSGNPIKEVTIFDIKLEDTIAVASKTKVNWHYNVAIKFHSPFKNITEKQK